MGRVSEMLNAQPGGLNKSFILAGTCLASGVILTFFLREKKAVTVEATAPAGELAVEKVSA